MADFFLHHDRWSIPDIRFVLNTVIARLEDAYCDVPWGLTEAEDAASSIRVAERILQQFERSASEYNHAEVANADLLGVNPVIWAA